MALVASWNAEGGTVDTAVTLANSGGSSGTAFNALNAGDGAYTYSSVASHGSYGMRVAQATTTMIIGWGTPLLGTLTSSYWRFMVRFTGYPASSQSIVRFRESGGATDYVLRLDVTGGTTTPGRWRLRDSAGATIVDLGVGMTADIWYRVELDIVHSSGSVTLRLYQGDSTTLVATTGTLTGKAIGTNIYQAHFGVLFASPQLSPFYLDDIAVDGTTQPGPVVVAPPAPVVVGFSGWGVPAGVTSA